MATDFLHPNISSRIIDNAVITVTSQGLTDKFAAFESTRGMPKKLQYVTNNTTFQFLYGEPNYRKYGQVGHNITNWLRGGGGVYCMKVSPASATFASLTLAFAKLDLKSITAVEALPALPARAGRDAPVSGEALYTLQAKDGNGKFLFNETTKLPTYETTASGSEAIPALSSVAAIAGRSAFNGGKAIVPVIYTSSDLKTLPTSIPNVKAKDLAGYSSASDSSLRIAEVVKFFPKGIGSYYNNIGISLTYNEDAESNYTEWAMFRLDVIEEVNGSSIVRESFDVALDDAAVSEARTSLYIKDVVNRYSRYLTCIANFDNFVALADSFLYETDTGTSGTSLNTDRSAISTMDLTKAIYGIEVEDDLINSYKLITASSIPSDYVNGLPAIPAVDAVAEAGAVASYKSVKQGTLAELPYRKGRDKRDEVDAIAGFKVNSKKIVILNDGAEMFLEGGNDGAWEEVDPSATAPQDLLELALVKAFNGTYDSSIIDPSLIEFDILLDANYPHLVKKAMSDLAATRMDCLAILDTGIETAYPTDAITIRDEKMQFDNYYTMLFTQHLNVDDEFTGRQIVVTPTFFLANKIVANDANYGIQYNFVGPRRGTITGFNSISWIPNEVEKEALYKKQLNYIEKDSIATLFATELTSQKKTTPLSQAHAVRILFRMIRNMKKIARSYKSEFNSSDIQASLQTELNGEATNWVLGGGCEYVVPVVSASEYQRAQRILQVQVNIKFVDLIERIQFDFIVNR